jgi:hypothetical protein
MRAATSFTTNRSESRDEKRISGLSAGTTLAVPNASRLVTIA